MRTGTMSCQYCSQTTFERFRIFTGRDAVGPAVEAAGAVAGVAGAALEEAEEEEEEEAMTTTVSSAVVSEAALGAEAEVEVDLEAASAAEADGAILTVIERPLNDQALDVITVVSSRRCGQSGWGVTAWPEADSVTLPLSVIHHEQYCSCQILCPSDKRM